MQFPSASPDLAHHPALVVLSLVVSLLTASTALSLADRGRGAIGRARLPWLTAAAIALGGGIWSMHFVTMLGVEIGIPVEYDGESMLASLALTILFVGGGLGIAVRRGGAA